MEKGRLQKLALRFFGRRIIREYPFEEMFFLDQARAVRAAVQVPLILLGGILSIDNLETAMREGFDFVAMGRALIADPDLIVAHAARRGHTVALHLVQQVRRRNGSRRRALRPLTRSTDGHRWPQMDTDLDLWR